MPLVAPSPYNHHKAGPVPKVFLKLGLLTSSPHKHTQLPSYLLLILKPQLKHHFLKPRSCSFIRRSHGIMFWIHVSQICDYTALFSSQPFIGHVLCVRCCSRYLRSIKETKQTKKIPAFMKLTFYGNE